MKACGYSPNSSGRNARKPDPARLCAVSEKLAQANAGIWSYQGKGVLDNVSMKMAACATECGPRFI
ncbi:hypothetical protein AWB65_04512 [Caballeronia humi]|uniref:Uncharacterized protein n=1 Tax=Caballeronia humi TaxID=326474 RepID=A0A158IB07_9BURK|nr:hypothetical protein AWB65_04512 [Caballeronia humi]